MSRINLDTQTITLSTEKYDELYNMIQFVESITKSHFLYQVKEHILFAVNERCNELLPAPEGNWFYDSDVHFRPTNELPIVSDFDENGNRRTHHLYIDISNYEQDDDNKTITLKII